MRKLSLILALGLLDSASPLPVWAGTVDTLTFSGVDFNQSFNLPAQWSDIQVPEFNFLLNHAGDETGTPVYLTMDIGAGGVRYGCAAQYDPVCLGHGMSGPGGAFGGVLEFSSTTGPILEDIGGMDTLQLGNFGSDSPDYNDYPHCFYANPCTSFLGLTITDPPNVTNAPEVGTASMLALGLLPMLGLVALRKRKVHS